MSNAPVFQRIYLATSADWVFVPASWGSFCGFILSECQTRKSDNRVEENLPIFQEIDLTGFGIRVGVNFFNDALPLLGFSNKYRQNKCCVNLQVSSFY